MLKHSVVLVELVCKIFQEDKFYGFGWDLFFQQSKYGKLIDRDAYTYRLMIVVDYSYCKFTLN
jgi:hypothetical protein